MNWKKEAAEKLRLYEDKRTSLDRSREELLRLENELTRVRSITTDGTPGDDK